MSTAELGAQIEYSRFFFLRLSTAEYLLSKIEYNRVNYSDCVTQVQITGHNVKYFVVKFVSG